MVHALLECWRTLEVGGALIDLRPLVSKPAIEIITTKRIFQPGSINDEVGKPDDDAADSAVSEVVQQGYFSLETQRAFKFNLYFDNLEEMIIYINEKWSQFAYIPSLVLERSRQQVAGINGPYQIRIQEQMQLGMYKKRRE